VEDGRKGAQLQSRVVSVRRPCEKVTIHGCNGGQRASKKAIINGQLGGAELENLEEHSILLNFEVHDTSCTWFGVRKE